MALDRTRPEHHTTNRFCQLDHTRPINTRVVPALVRLKKASELKDAVSSKLARCLFAQESNSMGRLCIVFT